MAAIVTLTRHPLYLILLFGVLLVTHMAVSQRRPETSGWRALIGLVAGVTLFIVPLQALSIHSGSHVLFRLPPGWPLIGGNITLEALLAGATNALALIALLLLFATMNLAISRSQMLHLTPPFLYEAGLIISIALTFVPQMMSSAQEIREAQRIRGHRMRRAHHMLPFVMALLTTGLERSFQLAESMEARGFGNVRARSRRQAVIDQALTLLGLGGFLSGFFALTYIPSAQVPGWIAVGASGALLLGIFWAQGRRVSRTHYRRDRWTWRDGVTLACSALCAAALVGLRLPGLWTTGLWTAGSDPLAYSPYAELVPTFTPWLGAVLLTLVAPAIVHSLTTAQEQPAGTD